MSNAPLTPEDFASPKELPALSSSVRATVVPTHGNWMVHDKQLNRMICLCVYEQDAKLIASLLNPVPAESDLRSEPKTFQQSARCPVCLTLGEMRYQFGSYCCDKCDQTFRADTLTHFMKAFEQGRAFEKLNKHE